MKFKIQHQHKRHVEIEKYGNDVLVSVNEGVISTIKLNKEEALQLAAALVSAAKEVEGE